MTKRPFGSDVVLAFVVAMSCGAAARAQQAAPAPSGLCGLETGPETFQIVVSSDAQVAQLKNLVGKEVAVKVGEVACSQEAGQMSDAVVSKWSMVSKP